MLRAACFGWRASVGQKLAERLRGEPRTDTTATQRKEDIVTTWLITGCSTGLGRAFARAVLGRGHNVVATARSAEAVKDLAGADPDRVLALALDVTNGAQITETVGAAEARFGSIDVLINNAGYGYRAAVEEGGHEDLAALFATNFFGPISIIQAVLPGMRARRQGTIVHISSIAARTSPPGSGYYAASKAALEAMTASLRTEVEPLGITAMIVEPGAFRTDFSGRSLTQSDTVIDDYADTAGARRKERDTTHGTQPGDPDKAAEALITAVESAQPPLMLILGPDALERLRASLDALNANLDAWEQTSTSTSFSP
jgi:NAD(P)-dependent dehydrogenase (short-subunit alcohol dehydrogenase family)